MASAFKRVKLSPDETQILDKVGQGTGVSLMELQDKKAKGLSTADESEGATGAEGGGFLDNVLTTIMGKPDEYLTEDEARARASRRANANAMARSASDDPGAGFMTAPAVGGSGFGLQDIAALLTGAGGADEKLGAESDAKPASPNLSKGGGDQGAESGQGQATAASSGNPGKTDSGNGLETMFINVLKSLVMGG